MNGWTGLVVVVALIVIASIGGNVLVWMRHRSLLAARGDWNVDDYTAAMVEYGISIAVADAVRAELANYYMADLTPRPDDELNALLRIDPDDLADIIERLFERLGMTLPGVSVSVPELATVRDLALYIDSYPARR